MAMPMELLDRVKLHCIGDQRGAYDQLGSVLLSNAICACRLQHTRRPNCYGPTFPAPAVSEAADVW